jgi:ATP-dependent RNA helicase DHX29
MAGAKKKKTKPAANPARGFATTSIASVTSRVEQTEETASTTPNPADPLPSLQADNATGSVPVPGSTDPNNLTNTSAKNETLSPEEFEKRLQESELQLLVEKHAQKAKRDAQRQKSRLETDRRLLRGQAESLNTRKWLPQELMDHILHLVQAESRFAASSLGIDNTSPGKLLPEEDLTIKLWTLQQTLASSGFAEDRLKPVLQYVLEIAPFIPGASKESIWGLEEALDWLARECAREELPDYEHRGKTLLKPADTPQDSPLPSGATTPRLLDPANGLKNGSAKSRSPRAASPRKIPITYDSDIEPDDLIPVYMETKASLFHLQRPKQGIKPGRGPKLGVPSGNTAIDTDPSPNDIKEARLLAKADRIEQDPLFDRDLADQKWKAERVVLEREFAAAKKLEAEEAQQAKEAKGDVESSDSVDSDDEIAKEAKRIAAEILDQEISDEDEAISDLFASLPVQEVDPSTGKTANVINGADGSKTFIRDFGKKWTGVSPTRALEETCRSR